MLYSEIEFGGDVFGTARTARVETSGGNMSAELPRQTGAKETRRDFLRRSTRRLHEQLDHSSSELDLSRADDYACLLVRHALALVPIELQLERDGVAQILGDWPDRRRRQSLFEDLAALGLSLPRADVPPARLTRSEIFGALYVLEGSRLGGEVLLRMVLAGKETGPRPSVRYLEHGMRSGLWRSFLARLEQAESLDMREVLSGANYVFEGFLASTLSQPKVGSWQ